MTETDKISYNFSVKFRFNMLLFALLIFPPDALIIDCDLGNLGKEGQR